MCSYNAVKSRCACADVLLIVDVTSTDVFVVFLGLVFTFYGGVRLCVGYSI